MLPRMAAWIVLAALLLASPSLAQRPDCRLVVSAPNRAYREVPVSVLIDTPARLSRTGSAAGLSVRVTADGRDIPAQARVSGAKTEITWIVEDLAKGGTRTYAAVLAPERRAAPGGVQFTQKGADVDIAVDGNAVARYDTTTGPNKPYLYPLYGPGQKLMVRGYPIEKHPGDSTDHPHHRGLWFTHGDVNGQDFWSEEARAGRTVHRAYQELISGPVYGRMRAATDWISKDGSKLAQDVREITVYKVRDGRLLDFSVEVRPVGGPLTFGDTKEGSFGLRLPDSMRVDRSGGHIDSSTGVRDAATWGKRADWVDYYGTVDGDTMGVAILDDPGNPRHPTYWHVRDYGLFAVNPFGVHDFVKGEPAGAGNLMVPVGGALKLRYRVFLHRGTTDDAHIADVWGAFSDPPLVTVSR